MKNAMKKLMSLVLVAVILVSALPFQASAAEAITVTVKRYLDGEQVSDKSFTVSEGETVYLDEALAMTLVKEGRVFDKWTNAEGKTATKISYEWLAKQDEGYYVNLYVKSPAETQAPTTEPTEAPTTEPTEAPTTAPTEAPTTAPTEAPTTAPTIDEEELKEQIKNEILDELEQEKEEEEEAPIKDSLNTYEIYLNVFKDNDIDDVYKVYTITDSLAADGVVSLKEVKNFIEDRFNAIDTDEGIIYDGLYMAQGNWIASFIREGTAKSKISGLEAARKQSNIFINVMIDNAKLESSSSSYTADSTNPKTGDGIFMAVTVMAVSASALALFFFYNKKRAAR